jgi:hypothetical protein
MNIISEDFVAAEVNKIFLVKNSRRFEDHICPNHHGLMIRTEMILETTVIFNQLTWLIPLEDFIINNAGFEFHTLATVVCTTV